MKLGLSIFPTDYSIGPAELAKLTEERGFESIWFPEHTHIPVSRRTAYPAGGELPTEYSHLLDPFVALTAAAAATERILLGTGICLIIERDPITTAKEVASLDRISDGRFLFGIGAGWNEEEMENHGTDPRRRFGLMRERVEAMQAIWTQDEASYHGEHVNFDAIWSWPKPTQKPYPPVIVAGNSDGALRRVVAFGNGWMPNPSTRLSILGEEVKKLEALAAEAGRERPPVTFYAPQPDAEKLERFAAAGVDRCILLLPPAELDQLEPVLDLYSALNEPYKD